jgi:hypothetical protein
VTRCRRTLDGEVDTDAGRQLTRLGHQAGSSLVDRMLHCLGYSLQATAKVTEGAQHPDRDATSMPSPLSTSPPANR